MNVRLIALVGLVVAAFGPTACGGKAVIDAAIGAGGAGGAGGTVSPCAAIELAYAAALDTAKNCSSSTDVPHCTVFVRETLSCCAFLVAVDLPDVTAFTQLSDQYQALNCAAACDTNCPGFDPLAGQCDGQTGKCVTDSSRPPAPGG